MDEIEQSIIKLAEKYKESDEFIQVLENLPVTQEEKGYFFFHVGFILVKFSYFSLAASSWNHALEYFLENKDRYGESECYANLGIAYRSLGDFRKAIEYHEKSLKIKKDIGDRYGESECYANLGIAYDSLGDFRKAIEYHEKSLKIKKDIGDRYGESECYANLGIAYDSLGDFRKAIEYHEKSLKIKKDIGDRYGESKCYGNLGVYYRSFGNYRKAIEYYKKSLEIIEEVGDKSTESKCYANIGNVYLSLRDYRKTIDYIEKSLEISKEIGEKAVESACYGNLGATYHILGDLRKAIEYYEKSLEIAKEIGDRSEESACYGNLGIAYHSLENPKKAIEYHEKSLEIMKEIGDRYGESECYMHLGNSYGNLGNPKRAIEYYEKSLEIAREIGDRAVESKCYTGLGIAYDTLGNLRESIRYLEDSLEIVQRTGNIDLERIINLNLGRIHHERKPELAYDYCKNSIKLSEMISRNFVEEEHEIKFSARVSDAYQYMIPLCLKLKKKEEAFEYVEKSKSEVLLDLLAATKIRPSIESTSELESLLEDEEIYLAKLREIQTRHLRKTKIPVKCGEVEEIYENLTRIYDKIEKFDPEYVFARTEKPISLDKIKNMLSSQKKDVILIEYFITEDMVIIFVVSSKDNELHIKTVPLSVEKLNHYLENYWREVVGYPDLQDIGNTWLRLSDYLIQPISEYLTGGELIYFVPCNSLHYLPLHALELKDEPLIKRHPVAYSPSASLIYFFKKKGSGTLQSCASFGAVYEEEAEKVAELFDTTAYLSHLATKDKAEKWTDKDVIHFSCHGYFHDVDPLSSGIILYNGILTAREIFNMKLNTELVTLNAFQTRFRKKNSEDELTILTYAFLYAGASSVIVSLWTVDAPSSTQELVLEFYKRLKNGVDKATALQQAQIRIMEKEEYLHPYYWAPFVLIGDWE